jgi:ABC-type antimicrobial peptide transport system permease subunit
VQPEVYIPLAQEQVQSFVVVVRTTTGDPLAPMPALRAALTEADPDVPITGVMSLGERITQTTAAPAFNALLMSTFAGTALLLAAAGVFAMVSFSVAERRREFGIRLAVGASRPRVFLHVLATNLRLAAWAIGTGLVCVTLGGRVLDGLLFGVSAADLSTLAGVAMVILGVVLAAGLWPARAATAVDPLAALRND